MEIQGGPLHRGIPLFSIFSFEPQPKLQPAPDREIKFQQWVAHGALKAPAIYTMTFTPLDDYPVLRGVCTGPVTSERSLGVH